MLWIFNLSQIEDIKMIEPGAMLQKQQLYTFQARQISLSEKTAKKYEVAYLTKHISAVYAESMQWFTTTFAFANVFDVKNNQLFSHSLASEL